MSDTTTGTKGSELLRSRLLDFADTQISELFDAVFPKVSHVVGRVLQWTQTLRQRSASSVSSDGVRS